MHNRRVNRRYLILSCNIIFHREAKHHTSTTLAKAIGMKWNTYRGKEAGLSRWTVFELHSIARTLELSLEDLLDTPYSTD